MRRHDLLAKLNKKPFETPIKYKGYTIEPRDDGKVNLVNKAGTNVIGTYNDIEDAKEAIDL